MKVNKVESFDVNRAINDFQSGRLEHMVAIPDFNARHQPHVDLTVRPTGGETVKYRVYDTAGASQLQQDFGPGGIGLTR